MNIAFSSDRFRKVCNNHRLLVKRHGLRRAQKIRRRLDDLRAARFLDDLRHLPGRCHELKGNRSDQLSLDLDYPYRLIFEPADDPSFRKPDGGLDWTKITDIVILGVEDTHE